MHFHCSVDVMKLDIAYSVYVQLFDHEALSWHVSFRETALFVDKVRMVCINTRLRVC